MSKSLILSGLANRGFMFCEELAEEGTPWEVPVEPEPQYFETLEEAIDFDRKIAERETRERCARVADRLGYCDMSHHLGCPVPDRTALVQNVHEKEEGCRNWRKGGVGDHLRKGEV